MSEQPLAGGEMRVEDVRRRAESVVTRADAIEQHHLTLNRHGEELKYEADKNGWKIVTHSVTTGERGTETTAVSLQTSESYLVIDKRVGNDNDSRGVQVRLDHDGLSGDLLMLDREGQAVGPKTRLDGEQISRTVEVVLTDLERSIDACENGRNRTLDQDVDYILNDRPQEGGAQPNVAPGDDPLV